jgi:amino acid transporter
MAAIVAISGSFGQLAVMANVATLSLYLLCCAASWQLVRKDVKAGGQPFRAPGGPLVPAAACLVIVWILSHATRVEFQVEGFVLAGAALLFAVRSVRPRAVVPTAADLAAAPGEK